MMLYTSVRPGIQGRSQHAPCGRRGDLRAVHRLPGGYGITSRKGCTWCARRSTNAAPAGTRSRSCTPEHHRDPGPFGPRRRAPRDRDSQVTTVHMVPPTSTGSCSCPARAPRTTYRACRPSSTPARPAGAYKQQMLDWLGRSVDTSAQPGPRCPGSARTNGWPGPAPSAAPRRASREDLGPTARGAARRTGNDLLRLRPDTVVEPHDPTDAASRRGNRHHRLATTATRRRRLPVPARPPHDSSSPGREHLPPRSSRVITHHAVTDVAVIGNTRPEWGQRVCPP